MKRFSWQVLLGLSLIVLSLVFYLIHYIVFRDPHHIFIFLLPSSLLRFCWLP
jgi:hypothetical protein